MDAGGGGWCILIRGQMAYNYWLVMVETDKHLLFQGLHLYTYAGGGTEVAIKFWQGTFGTGGSGGGGQRCML
jgi:hypothetical protein